MLQFCMDQVKACRSTHLISIVTVTESSMEGSGAYQVLPIPHELPQMILQSLHISCLPGCTLESEHWMLGKEERIHQRISI